MLLGSSVSSSISLVESKVSRMVRGNPPAASNIPMKWVITPEAPASKRRRRLAGVPRPEDTDSRLQARVV